MKKKTNQDNTENPKKRGRKKKLEVTTSGFSQEEDAIKDSEVVTSVTTTNTDLEKSSLVIDYPADKLFNMPMIVSSPRASFSSKSKNNKVKTRVGGSKNSEKVSKPSNPFSSISNIQKKFEELESRILTLEVQRGILR